MSSFKLINKKDNSDHIEFISKFLHFRNQIHIYHFQTNTYSSHIAFGELYNFISEALDELIETLQGKLESKFNNYISYNYKNNDDTCKCLDEMLSDILKYRNSLKEKSWDNIDNQLQVIQDKLEKTKYLMSLK